VTGDATQTIGRSDPKTGHATVWSRRRAGPDHMDCFRLGQGQRPQMIPLHQGRADRRNLASSAGFLSRMGFGELLRIKP
jgi:hypothetical protein